MESTKMKTTLLLGLGLAVSFNGGCTTTRTLSASPSNEAAAMSEQGMPCLRSVKANAVTVWLLTSKYRSDPREFNPPVLRVLVRNGGDKAFTLSTDSIAASSGTSSVRVITSEEYRREIGRREQELLQGVDGTVAKRLAGEEALREYADTLAPQTEIGAQGELMHGFSWREYDSMTVAKAGIETEAETQRAAIRGWSEKLLDDAPMMLTRITVAPGLMAGGLVKLDPSQIRRGQPLRLVVTVGGEAHEFLFDVRS